MGTWLETCAVSHLPIPQGTPTRVVLLVQSPDYTEGCHAGHTGGWSLWTPWSLPILGTYDGYGRVDGTIPDWHFTLLRQRLEEDAVSDISELRDFHGLQEITKRGRLEVRASINREEKQPMGLCFIRDDVYTALGDTPVYADMTVRTAKDRVEKTLAEFREVKTSPLHTGELNDTIRLFNGTEFGDSVQKMLGNLVEYRRLTEATGSYGPPGFRGVGSYRLRVAEWIMKGLGPTHPDVTDAGTELGTFLHFLLHFEQLRLLWGPQAGMGSQTKGWESHLTLARIVRGVSVQEFEAETGAYEDPAVEEPEITD